MDDGGKAITFSEWATLAQDRTGWLKLVTKAPFNIGKPQLRPPRCGPRVTPEEKQRFLARHAQETKQRRALFNAETDAETTQVRFQNYFMNSFRFKGGWKYYSSFPLHTILLKCNAARLSANTFKLTPYMSLCL